MEIAIPLIVAGVYFLPQLVTTGMLIRRIARPMPRLHNAEVVLYVMCLTIVPTLMLLGAVTTFAPGWKGDRSGWTGVIDVGAPGCWGFVVWLTACGSVFAGLARESRLFTSKKVFVAIAVLALICFWYTGMYPVYSGLSHGDGMDISSLKDAARLIGPATAAAIPGIVCVNLVLLMIGIARRGQLVGRVRPTILAWLAALIATVIAKCWTAIHYYESLPDDPPASCFIVTAAARGHEAFVGSWPDPATGWRVNRQLRTMRAVESRLIECHPRLHGAVRGVYNVVGPAVAGCIRSRIAADAMFVLLKPIELLGACYLRCSTGPKGD